MSWNCKTILLVRFLVRQLLYSVREIAKEPDKRFPSDSPVFMRLLRDGPCGCQ